MDWLLTGAGILVLLFSLLWPWFWSLTSLSLLTLSSLAFGLACAVWAHIYLSSQHYTPACLLEHIDKDLQVFRENISVSSNLLISYFLNTVESHLSGASEARHVHIQ